MFALLDANNFYVSAERVFQPELLKKPVVVLSNNEGCAVSRSDEAKALGIRMGQPLFEIKHLKRTHGLVALPSNYVLYADMSARMMGAAAEFAPRQETYSIDEVFQDYDGVHGNLLEIGREMRAKVLKWTGLPTGVGFGPTKTLAKLANHVAKSAERKPGSYPSEYSRVFNMGALSDSQRVEILEATPVREVWGVGSRIEKHLLALGVDSARRLSEMDPAFVRRRFSVVLEKTVLELRGISCLALDEVAAPKQQIVVSRSFGTAVSDLHVLASAVTAHASTAAAKLRAQASYAGTLIVFAQTSPFRSSEPQHSGSATLQIEPPTNDTAALVAAAVQGLRHLYREGFKYAKAGVMLSELSSARLQQGCLEFGCEDPVAAPEEEAKAMEGALPATRDRSKLMLALDGINARYGRGTLQMGSIGNKPEQAAWAMRQSRKTPGFTTHWEDLPVVRA